ncbi:ORF6N domain-containing protein [Salmonella enterica]|uniref:ORF6N domain-containing protein n=2 Tax=Salmonella enterica TaxID=28901 RepID=A0A8F5MYK2_SALDZ|nr:ORF6N domain-containing protein [Salmonella enterica]EAA9934019.1 ORF6N domain-containing protein [Salmonella enterica subsp. salamae]EBP3979370.1 ORF6N domain-containing protein [Salmonella enterica subsp. enterica]EDU6438671.1 ORF6N domain-containing protein [Salmonella enterica subsp. salamae serovar 47:b:e,n,x,z15]QXN82694.1 ORF6N domain-containing protein [Salmonella enterica subsp. diarizonae]HCM1972377.1 ORF6N domain-containing protein [Salmonella enterica subsp. salamae serovar 52:z
MTTQISVETLSPITHNQIPVITTELLAQLYGTEPVRVRQGYSRNQSRFIEGKHFFKLMGSALKSFKNEVSLNDFVKIAPTTNHLILWTERGAARHAKMLETDQA